MTDRRPRCNAVSMSTRVVCRLPAGHSGTNHWGRNGHGRDIVWRTERGTR